MSRLSIKGPILITGSQGMLGSEFADFLRRHASQIPLIETHSSTFDITDEKSVDDFLKQVRPEWIINAAAYTDVDKAESERERAYQVNAIGPKNLAQYATKFGAKLVHFSTDYVFDGHGDKPWVETDKPNPVKPNWYAETKLMGEKFVLEGPKHLVFRVQWLYGKQKERFSSLKNNKIFTPFSDQFGAPTWTLDIVSSVLKVMSHQEASGLFHFSYDDYASWFDVYQFVKEEWKLNVQLIGKKLSEVSLPAKRPNNGRLSNLKLKQLLKVASLGSWRASLREFLKQVPK